jgi:hypothetical protein
MKHGSSFHACTTAQDFSAFAPTGRHDMLLIGSAPAIGAAVLAAAAETHWHVGFARPAREGFQILLQHYSDIDIVIADLESALRGLAVVLAPEGCREKPAIVLTTPERCSLDQSHDDLK